MINRVFGPLLCGGLLMFAVPMPAGAQPAPPVTFACHPTKVRGAASMTGASRNIATFGNVPEAVVHFTQGGRIANCVLVRFSAEVLIPNTGGMEVRAYLDNTTAALPPEAMLLATPVGAFSGHTFEFVFPSVAPGNHVVRMQFRSMGSDPVALFRHNTVVQFTP